MTPMESIADKNRRRFTQMYLDAYRGDFALIKEIMSPAFICRNPLQPIDGVNELEAMLQAQIASFENVEFKVRWSFASEEGFGIAYTITGRHVGTIFGLEPSGELFEVQGVSIHEIANEHSIGVFSSANFIEVLAALKRR
jgi:hypothetical protein